MAVFTISIVSIAIRYSVGVAVLPIHLRYLRVVEILFTVSTVHSMSNTRCFSWKPKSSSAGGAETYLWPRYDDAICTTRFTVWRIITRHARKYTYNLRKLWCAVYWLIYGKLPTGAATPLTQELHSWLWQHDRSVLNNRITKLQSWHRAHSSYVCKMTITRTTITTASTTETGTTE